MLRDLLRPRLLVSHLLVLTVAVTCVLLGEWQLRRLDEVRTNNERLAERLEAAPVELEELLGTEIDQDALEFRRVTVTGTYRPDDEVLQRGRQHDQRQGFHILTPLEVDADHVVLVRRGWVPVELSDPPVEEAAPPTGEVELQGILELPVEQPSGLAPRDPEDGVLERVFHADTTRLARQIDGSLFPMVVRLDAPSDAAVGALPEGLDPPVLDEANHLSYALQWFSFALLAIVTYGAWLWSRHRRNRLGTGGDTPGGGDDDALEPPTTDAGTTAPQPQR